MDFSEDFKEGIDLGGDLVVENLEVEQEFVDSGFALRGIVRAKRSADRVQKIV